MAISKSDIIPILKYIAAQKCEYTLLRPENLIERPNSYNDIDLCMRADDIAKFIVHLTACANAMGGSVEARRMGPFETAVAIKQNGNDAIKIDIQSRIAWRGFQFFECEDISKTGTYRDNIRHVDKKYGDIVMFVKEILGRKNVRRKPEWWRGFAERVAQESDVYEAILKDHAFRVFAGKLIGRIKCGDYEWIENRAQLLRTIFIVTQLSRQPISSVLEHSKWWYRSISCRLGLQ